MHYAGEGTSGSSTETQSETWQAEDSRREKGESQERAEGGKAGGWRGGVMLWLRKHGVIFGATQTEEEREIKRRIREKKWTSRLTEN